MEYVDDVLAVITIALVLIWLYWPVTTGLKAELKIASKGHPELEKQVSDFLATNRPTGFKAGLLLRGIIKHKQRKIAES